MRSRGYWAIVAVVTTVVALGVTAGQASANTQKKTCTGPLCVVPLVPGPVTHHEYAAWVTQVDTLKKDYWGPGIIDVDGQTSACASIIAAGQSVAPLAAVMETDVKVLAQAQHSVVPFIQLGLELKGRSSKYAAAGIKIRNGAGDIYDALKDLQRVLTADAAGNCNQTLLAAAVVQGEKGFNEIDKGFNLLLTEI